MAVVRPSLPPVLAPPTPAPTHSVLPGAWLINYDPAPFPTTYPTFDGTLRVDRDATGHKTISGDLYRRQYTVGPPLISTPPNPTLGIPIQRRDLYSYYIRATKFVETATSVTLGFELWHYSAGTWSLPTHQTASLVWATGPNTFPSPSYYLKGAVTDDNTHQHVANFTMGWVSKRFRMATIEIDTVWGSEAPLDSGTARSWNSVFADVNWTVNVIASDNNVAEPGPPLRKWTNAELHAAMLKSRDMNRLDVEWRYHILAVKELLSTERGLMYDDGPTDSDNVPREGVGIASHWIFPAAGWGGCNGRRFGTCKDAYFRTAVHEMGHAFGLQHNTADLGFMNTTPGIAAKPPPPPFPDNIMWGFNPIDIRRLRHWPDVYVRPGGLRFGSAPPTDAEANVPSLKLDVQPVLSEVPLGAPVRIAVKLTNVGETPIQVPADISLKSSSMSGAVEDSSGKSRKFSPIIICGDDHRFVDLAPGDELTASMTLLRGGDGALFPTSGISEITVKASWDINNGEAQAVVSGKTTVTVTPPVTPGHAQAAQKILTTPDTHLVLVVGGDHLTEGLEAIDAAIANSTLRPHFAAIKAKCLAEPFLNRPADVVAARAYLEGDVVMSPAEEDKINNLVAVAEALRSA